MSSIETEPGFPQSSSGDSPSLLQFTTLTPAQIRAIDALMAGLGYETAAESAGVHRVTVSRWANHHPAFIAEMNRRRRELLAESADRIRRLDNLALRSVQERIENGDPGAADAWIKTRDVAKIANSIAGLTDGNEIIQQRIDRKERELAARKLSAEDDTPYTIELRDHERDLIRREVYAELAELLDDAPPSSVADDGGLG